MAAESVLQRGLRVALCLSGLSLSVLALGGASSARAQGSLIEGLDYPWAIAPAPDGLYLTEKSGMIGHLSARTLQDGEGQDYARLPVRTSAPILDDRGGGLLGLALRPDFATSRRAVAYHHTGTPEARTNRVVELELQGEAWVETRVLLDAIPGHPLYNGGRVAFGPDGMLYVTTGWIETPALPQDRGSLAGKILRLTPEGAVPRDNPFPGSPVWSLGHRNPQGLAWDDQGRMYAAEHGQAGHDEVNLIEKGGNYGWPLVQGDETAPGMTAPLVHSGRATWAPSGLAWDARGNRLLLASLRQGAVLAITPENPSGSMVAEAFATDARMRDVAVIDGQVVAITTNRSPRRDGPSDDRMIRLSR